MNYTLKNYRSGFEAKNILDQIIFNINFPRSVHYSVQQAQRYFERLKNERNMESFEKINFMIGKLRSNIQFSNVESIIHEGPSTILTRIHQRIIFSGQRAQSTLFCVQLSVLFMPKFKIRHTTKNIFTKCLGS